MNNTKQITIGGIVILVAAIVVVAGLLYWAFDSEDSGIEGESIVSFELGEDALLVTSVGMESIEVRYLPAGENPAEVVLGTMTQEETDDDFQKWSRALPSEPLLVQTVTAHGFVDGVEVDSVELGADDLAELRVLWFEVPTDEAELAIGESADINGLSITLVDILEDSRCPDGAQCIQAGQVRAQVKMETAGGSQIAAISTNGDGIGFDNYFVEMVSVEPQAVLSSEIVRGDYRVTFAVSRDIKL